MAPYTESDIQNAIADYRGGKSERKAAHEWGIPRSTLKHRLKGGESRSQAQSDYQRLTRVQEDHLAQWILTQGALGYAPSHAQIRLFAARIMHAGGDSKRLGKHWMQHFLRRNPAIKTLRGKKIDYQRVNGASPANIKKFFQRLAHPAIKDIPACHRYNMDETGMMEGEGINGLVVGAAGLKSVYVKKPESRTWSTIIECISADGRAIAPTVIFKGASVQAQWFPDSDPERFAQWYFTSSENGWTSQDIALKWLLKSFIPQTKSDTSQRRLLVVDGHGSHETDDFMWNCYLNNIYLLFLPPHSSHVLQPLDLSVFSPLKGAYRKRIEYLLATMEISDSSPIGKRTFLVNYCGARDDVFIERIIKAGWKATGLWPISINKPLNSSQLLPTISENDEQTRMVPEKRLPQDSCLPTPSRSFDIVRDLKGHFDTANPAARLIFRKIGKGLDGKNLLIAKYEARIKALEEQVEELRPKKRRKVREDPNERFVTIEQVMKTKEAIAKEVPVVTGTADYVFEDMCFEWQLVVPIST